MLVSEVMAKGMALAPGGTTGRLFRSAPNPDDGLEACAVGTLYLGLGLTPDWMWLGNGPTTFVTSPSAVYEAVAGALTALGMPVVRACPVAGCREPPTTSYDPRWASWVFWHLNDAHCWTREQIAAWADTQLQQQERRAA